MDTYTKKKTYIGQTSHEKSFNDWVIESRLMPEPKVIIKSDEQKLKEQQEYALRAKEHELRYGKD
jgi:hypothetical protein